MCCRVKNYLNLVLDTPLLEFLYDDLSLGLPGPTPGLRDGKNPLLLVLTMDCLDDDSNMF